MCFLIWGQLEWIVSNSALPTSRVDHSCVSHFESLSHLVYLDISFCMCESSFLWQQKRYPIVTVFIRGVSTLYLICYQMCVVWEETCFWTSALWSDLKSCKNILVSSLSKFTPNFLRQEEGSQTKPDARKASDDEETCAQTESELISANPARIRVNHGASECWKQGALQ